MANNGRLPGAVIGQVFRPGTGTPRDFPRNCGIIAKGLDLKLFRDTEVVRAQVEGETLPFSGVTYLAPLAHDAVPDKARSRLYLSDGRTISATRWNFIESVPGTSGFDQISIDPSIFNAQNVYLMDYVSVDPALQDGVPIAELREVTAVGDNAGQVQYAEGVDYRFISTATGPDAAAANQNPTASAVTAVVPTLVGGSTGIVAHNSNTYTHGYNRAYIATVTAAAGASPAATATIEIQALPTSSGTNAIAGKTTSQQNIITIGLIQATPATLTNIAVEFGITLDFTIGAANFVVGDTFTFSGVGPGTVELADAMLNTNQFAATSAVVNGTGNAGQGTITVNPQSVYTGGDNSPYELEVTAIAGVGVTRTATIRWRTTPQLLTFDGTVTATNASATVTGVGTSFTADVAAGDLLFIGVNPSPVTVLSVTDATTLVLTAVYPYATQATVKVLRSRERTASIAIPIATSTRVTLDSGVFIDLDYGPLAANNFAIGDTFTFTGQVARKEYNGKENRNYDITVTDTTTLGHSTTMTYSGSTAASGFGSQVFSEGNPLILANNLVLHARNNTLTNRYNAVAPADVFDLTLTFDGFIDWTLNAERTETIATGDMLRDLTGSVTGTVGAYFILLKKVPSAIRYVRGPSTSFTNFAFNQVTNSTVVYFTTDPGVNLTISYEWKGAEPAPGSTYFLTGFKKRPATDFQFPQLFFTKDAANDFLAPMTPQNDAAIANQIAWDQDEQNLPGVVIFLVPDSDGDGVYTTADYTTAIEVSEDFTGTMDAVVVNQFSAREEFRDSVVNMNDPTVARRRIGYFGFPTNYPIGDEFTPDSRVYVARREIQVFANSVAKGSLAIIGNSFAKKTILVDSLGNQDSLGTVPTQVTLDGSFLAVALAARVASFNEPWEVIYNVSVSGFDEIEVLTEGEMIRLFDAGIIPIRVEGGSGFYVGTSTTDETEPSTQQLSGTVQRQYVLDRLQYVIDSRVIGFVADSPEEVSQKLGGELVAELGTMISERKIAPYIDPSSGTKRPILPETDVVAFRDARDLTKAFFRASWNQKYPILFVAGIVAVDAPTP